MSHSKTWYLFGGVTLFAGAVVAAAVAMPPGADAWVVGYDGDAPVVVATSVNTLARDARVDLYEAAQEACEDATGTVGLVMPYSEVTLQISSEGTHAEQEFLCNKDFDLPTMNTRAKGSSREEAREAARRIARERCSARERGGVLLYRGTIDEVSDGSTVLIELAWSCVLPTQVP